MLVQYMLFHLNSKDNYPQNCFFLFPNKLCVLKCLLDIQHYFDNLLHICCNPASVSQNTFLMPSLDVMSLRHLTLNSFWCWLYHFFYRYCDVIQKKMMRVALPLWAVNSSYNSPTFLCNKCSKSRYRL